MLVLLILQRLYNIKPNKQTLKFEQQRQRYRGWVRSNCQPNFIERYANAFTAFCLVLRVYGLNNFIKQTNTGVKKKQVHKTESNKKKSGVSFLLNPLDTKQLHSYPSIISNLLNNYSIFIYDTKSIMYTKWLSSFQFYQFNTCKNPKEKFLLIRK